MFNFQNPNAAPNVSQTALDFFTTPNAMSPFGAMINGGGYIDPATGRLTQALYNQGGGADSQPGPVEGFAQYAPRAEGNYFQYGDSYDRYSPTGEYEASANFKDPKTKLDTYGPLIVGAMAGLGALAGGGFGGAGAVGSGGGFVGEGALSGIGAWDGALASAPSWSAGAAGAGGFLGDATAGGYGGIDAASAATMGGGGSFGGGAAGSSVPSFGSLLKSDASSLLGGGSGGGNGWLGTAATLAGGLLGSQGQDASTSSTRSMDPRMDSLFYNDLAPRTQQTMAGQMGAAQGAGSQMLQVGSGLLGQTAPNTATNPYATGILDDMERRYNDLIAQRLQQVKGNAIGVGGLGGSRQGVAEAQAITQGADNFAGQGLNFMGGLYTGDQNRLLQQQTLGAGLMSQGLNTPFQPLQQTSQIYSPFTGFGTTTNNQQSGGGWQGAVGGALGAAQMGKNMGWW